LAELTIRPLQPTIGAEIGGVDLSLPISDATRDEIKAAVRYKVGGREVRDWPGDLPDFDALEPVYQSHPGWSEDITRVRKFEDLPKNARAYVEWLEREVGVPIVMLSVGPEREQVISREKVASREQVVSRGQKA